MINRYRRAARTWSELDLGALSPLDEAIPELRAPHASPHHDATAPRTSASERSKEKIPNPSKGMGFSTSGEGEIRTRGTVTRPHDFQSCTFGHSVTSPKVHEDYTNGPRPSRRPRSGRRRPPLTAGRVRSAAARRVSDSKLPLLGAAGLRSSRSACGGRSRRARKVREHDVANASRADVDVDCLQFVRRKKPAVCRGCVACGRCNRFAPRLSGTNLDPMKSTRFRGTRSCS